MEIGNSSKIETVAHGPCVSLTLPLLYKTKYLYARAMVTGYETLYKDVTLFCSMVCIRHSWAASCIACSAALRTSQWDQQPSCLSSHLSMQARDRVILRLFSHAPQPIPTFLCKILATLFCYMFYDA